MAIRFDTHVTDHNGIKGFYKTIKPVSLVEFKQIAERDQKLADPSVGDGWLYNYLQDSLSVMLNRRLTERIRSSENHDQARSISRFMSDKPEYRVISAKSLAIFLICQSGTPIVYQGGTGSFSLTSSVRG